MPRIIWRFPAKARRVDEFCNGYGWKGKWAKLFGPSPEYEGAILLQDLSDPLVFIVIDRWASVDWFTRFLQLFRPDYENLDRQSNELTDEETLIGNFRDEVVWLALCRCFASVAERRLFGLQRTQHRVVSRLLLMCGIVG